MPRIAAPLLRTLTRTLSQALAALRRWLLPPDYLLPSAAACQPLRPVSNDRHSASSASGKNIMAVWCGRSSHTIVL